MTDAEKEHLQKRAYYNQPATLEKFKKKNKAEKVAKLENTRPANFNAKYFLVCAHPFCVHRALSGILGVFSGYWDLGSGMSTAAEDLSAHL